MEHGVINNWNQRCLIYLETELFNPYFAFKNRPDSGAGNAVRDDMTALWDHTYEKVGLPSQEVCLEIGMIPF